MTDRVQFDKDTGNAALRVGIYNEFDQSNAEQDFHSFPIRLGRNPRNDLVLQHEYVSQWHAVIGFVSGQLSIVQVGSSNSVRVDGRKLRPNEMVPLAGHEEIRVVPFQIRMAMSGSAPEVAPAYLDAPFPPAGSQHQVPLPQPPQGPAEPLAPGPMGAPLGPGSLPFPPGTDPQHLPGSTGPLPELRQSAGSVGPLQPPGQQAQPQQYGGVGPATGGFGSTGPQVPSHAAMPAGHGGHYLDGSPSQGEAMAALNRIAEQYWGRPLQNGQEAAYFGARLESVLGRLLSGVYTLRSGQLQFLQEMGIKNHDDNPVDRLESPAHLGAALLSAQDQRIDPGLAEAFERLKLHQLALLRGLGAGVRALMRRLSPATVEKQTRSSNSRGLWDYYCQVHGDLDEEQARFKILYGVQFKKAYSKLVDGKKKKKTTG